MKKLISQIIVLIVMLLISSCYREKLVGEYYLTDDMKEQNPFKGFEKLSFVDDTRAIIELAGGDRINKINKYFTDHTHREYQLCEEDHITFTNQSYNLSINMDACSSMESIHIALIYLEGNYVFYSKYPYELDTFLPNYIDSLLINDVWMNDIFYDTMKFVAGKPFPDELERYPVKSYYSTHSGIVKIDFSNSTSWELEKTEW